MMENKANYIRPINVAITEYFTGEMNLKKEYKSKK